MVHRSSPAKTSNKTKPRYRIPAISKARYARMKEYGKLRKEFLATNKLCARCGKKATDIHHTRGRVGRLLCMSAHWISVCRQCHQWIGENPNEARAEGLLCELGKWNTL